MFGLSSQTKTSKNCKYSWQQLVDWTPMKLRNETNFWWHWTFTSFSSCDIYARSGLAFAWLSNTFFETVRPNCPHVLRGLPADVFHFRVLCGYRAYRSADFTQLVQSGVCVVQVSPWNLLQLTIMFRCFYELKVIFFKSCWVTTFQQMFGLVQNRFRSFFIVFWLVDVDVIVDKNIVFFEPIFWRS